MDKCPKCGAKLRETAKFCSRCGRRVQGSWQLWTVFGVAAVAFVAWRMNAASPSETLSSENLVVQNLAVDDWANSGSDTDSNAVGTPVESSGTATGVPPTSDEGRIPISIRSLADGKDELAYLVRPVHTPADEETVRAIEDSGLPCGQALGIHQLEQNGERIDIYKVDCSAGSYQLTEMNGTPYVKPWTGVMIGQ